jgi:hypothetical protein
MSKYGLLLALCVLALVVLMVCDRPLGLPDEAHTASVAYCTVDGDDDWSGYINYFRDFHGQDSLYARRNPLIKRRYQELDGRPYPRSNGFCVFHVPYIEGEDEIHACTLYYRQKTKNGGPPWPRLKVTRLLWDPRETSDYGVFWDAWLGDSIAGDSTHWENDWYAIPLSTEACAEITMIADGGGGDYYTGWVYPEALDDMFTDVYGSGLLPPYIKVVYQP